MRRLFMAVALPVLGLSSHALLDGLIYENDFSQDPEDWYHDSIWEFGSDGAVVQTTEKFWDATLFSGQPDDRLIFFVPDGADSIGIVIPYTLEASVYEGSILVEVRLGTDSGWEDIWFQYEQDDYISESDTISCSPDYVQGGDWVGIFFAGFGNCDTWGSMDVLWQVHSITITAYGDSLYFEPASWAGIKAAGDSE